MSVQMTPGIYKARSVTLSVSPLRTGIPAFLGALAGADVEAPVSLGSWSHFARLFDDGGPRRSGMAAAVHGFFINGGQRCEVVPLNQRMDPRTALERGLAAIAANDQIDLICLTDAMRYEDIRPNTIRPFLPNSPEFVSSCTLQQVALADCDRRNDRIVILDSVPGADMDTVQAQRRWLNGHNGALYYPWIAPSGGGSFLPPSGHVAGIFARCDARTGVHKAPANEVLEGVVDLETVVGNAAQAMLNPDGINAIRAFPGRGIRVWGARTVSPDANWTYINVRRLFLTASRWVQRNLTGAAFEPNESRLWARIVRELTAYFSDLHRQGALLGATPDQAFYIKCDSETNSAEDRDTGRVVTEIGLAPTVPEEFVVVRMIAGSGTVNFTGLGQPV